ncbi:MAG: HK97 gp10 family phage protein [Oscillospiraceae bacterium]|nr:HK97 gp10 family phage protein [Oscillospiraceae bacterium]
MARSNIQMDGRELKKLRDQLEAVANPQKNDEFLKSCAKELAARLLRKVIKRTPVGQYPADTGKVGGTLRRGWTTGSTGDSSHDTRQAMYSNMFGGSQHVRKADMTVSKVGNDFVIEIINPVEYASYVEYGHRTRDHKGWVKGRFMLTISENEIRHSAPAILERKLEQYLKECFK